MASRFSHASAIGAHSGIPLIAALFVGGHAWFALSHMSLSLQSEAGRLYVMYYLIPTAIYLITVLEAHALRPSAWSLVYVIAIALLSNPMTLKAFSMMSGPHYYWSMLMGLAILWPLATFAPVLISKRAWWALSPIGFIYLSVFLFIQWHEAALMSDIVMWLVIWIAVSCLAFFGVRASFAETKILWQKVGAGVQATLAATTLSYTAWLFR